MSALDLTEEEAAALKAAVLERLLADCEALETDPAMQGEGNERRAVVEAEAKVLESLTRKLRMV